MARRGAPEIPVAVGDTLAGKYLVERILGAGGMGVVVAAKHLQLGERVALKFLLPDALKHPEVTARFEQEGQTAAKVRSEHVARIHDVGTLENGAPFIVMEYLEGKDLAALLDERGPIPLEDATLYLLQICEALAEAHSLGIVHRDLKPGNLILTKKRDGSPALKLIDFGISKLMTPAVDRQMTQPAMMMGSPLYMAPEQMASARDVDHRTDIWSLGAIYYQLLTGKPPYDGKSVAQVYDLILAGPPPLRASRPNLPDGVDAIIRRCLRKDPAQRFDNVAELAAALVPFGPPLAVHTAESIRRVLGATALTRAPVPSPLVDRGSDTETDELSIDLASEPPVAAPPRAPPPRAPGSADRSPAPIEARPARPAPRAPAAPPLDLTPIPFLSPPTPAAPPPAAPFVADDDAPLAAPAHKHDEVADAGETAEQAVREALGSHGIAGKVLLKGRQLELHGVGAPLTIDVGPLGEQWALLPPEMRRRKSIEAARRLADAHRAGAALTARPGTGASTGASASLLGKLAAGAALLVGAAVLAQLYVKSQAPPPPPPPVHTETADEERQRLATTCTAMRQRIYSGATVGPYEAGGWAVELWLANRSGPAPREAPALGAAVSNGKLAPSADALLAEIKDGTLAFDDAGGAFPGASKSPAWRSATLVFGGGYARAFFDADQRARFLGLADRLAEATGAELGSLHARCAHLSVHDVGAWFRGRDVAGATTALLIGVGLAAERPAIDRDALARFPGPGELDSLHQAAAAAKLDLTALKSLVGEQGGSVTALPTSVTLTFPVGGPIRATSAGRALGKRLGLARSETPQEP
jgi:serine/threonine-protein kinase